ncbi:hypothetical protein ACHAXT_011464 [Thalassiosira profunda]
MAKSVKRKHVYLILAPSILGLAYLRLARQLMRYQAFNAKEAAIECARKGKIHQVTLPEFFDPHSKCTHDFKESAVFFHAGKGGGGTVLTELRRYRIGVSGAHPGPKRDKIKALQNGPAHTLILNVRDPVDRFVSAFRWRLVVLCRPDDARIRQKKGAAQRPHEVCKTSKKMDKEEEMLRETYKADPSVIGEALCEESPLREQAMKDYSDILHSLPISGWLDFLVDPELRWKISSRGISNFVALPMERRQGSNETLFENHIQQLSSHLLESKYGEETAKAIMAQEPATLRDGLKEQYEHSSAKFHEATKASPPKPLSRLGECCLARHLGKDYNLIKMMLGDGGRDKSLAAVEILRDAHPVIAKACSWGSKEQQELCRSDLRSMLSRRAKYLDRSLGTCAQIVASK